MDPRISELKQAALKYRAQRKYDRAEATFRELAEIEPKNPRWPHKLGEARRSLGDTAAAVEAFEQAADAYLEKGFILKAIALCKMIMGLDPDNTRTQATLLRLHAVPPDKMRPRTEPELEAAPGSATAHDSIPLSGGQPSPTAEMPKEGWAPVMREMEFDPDGGVKEAAPPEPVLEIPPPQQEEELQIEVKAEPGTRHSPEDTLDSIPILTVAPELIPAVNEKDESGVFEIPLELEEEHLPALVEDDVAQHLPPIPLLSSLSQHELAAFARRVEVQQYEPEEVIIRQGSRGDSLFILVEGKVAVVREETPRVTLGVLTEGAFFGEYALLTDLERSATVEALEECTVLTISRALMRELVLEHPPVFRLMLRFFRDRMVGNLTRTHELFKPFTQTERRALIKQFSWLEAPADKRLVEAGQKPDGLYLLVCGQATVHRSGKLPGVLRTGEMFCKTALMTSTFSSHTVRTRSKCWILRLTRAKFRELIMTHPHVLATLSEAGPTGVHQVQDPSREDREETMAVV